MQNGIFGQGVEMNLSHDIFTANIEKIRKHDIINPRKAVVL